MFSNFVLIFLAHLTVSGDYCFVQEKVEESISVESIKEVYSHSALYLDAEEAYVILDYKKIDDEKENYQTIVIKKWKLKTKSFAASVILVDTKGSE